MTLRNIGIVFSPTLGIPAGIFSEMITHFGTIFDDEVETLDTRAEEDTGPGSVQFENADETVKRKRNSLLCQAGEGDALSGLSGRTLNASEDLH